MSKIRKTIGLDKVGIESLSVPEKDKQYFRQLVGQLEQAHQDMRDNAEAGGFQTKTWRKVEDSNGDLVTEHLENGIWVERGPKVKGS